MFWAAFWICKAMELDRQRQRGVGVVIPASAIIAVAARFQIGDEVILARQPRQQSAARPLDDPFYHMELTILDRHIGSVGRVMRRNEETGLYHVALRSGLQLFASDDMLDRMPTISSADFSSSPSTTNVTIAGPETDAAFRWRIREAILNPPHRHMSMTPWREMLDEADMRTGEALDNLGRFYDLERRASADLAIDADGMIATAISTVESLTRQMAVEMPFLEAMLGVGATSWEEEQARLLQHYQIGIETVVTLDDIAATFGLGDESMFVVDRIETERGCPEHCFEEVMTAGMDRAPICVTIVTNEPTGLNALVDPYIRWPMLTQLMTAAARWGIKQRPALGIETVVTLDELLTMGRAPNDPRTGQRGWSERQKSAHDRSIALLKEWLTPAQREQYERDGTFEVVGGTTGKRYRINRPGPYNIAELDNPIGLAASICIEPKRVFGQPQLPDGDVMLLQKIALEENEAETLRVANRRPRNPLIDEQR